MSIVTKKILLGSSQDQISDYWILKLGCSGNGQGLDFSESAGTDIFVAGYQSSLTSGGLDSVAMRITRSGEISWQRVHGGSGDEIYAGMSAGSDSVYIFGRSSSLGASNGVYLYKYDIDGNYQWSRQYISSTGSFESFYHGVDINPIDNNVVVAIRGGTAGVAISKVSPSNSLVFTRATGTASYGSSVIHDSSGNIYHVFSDRSKLGSTNDAASIIKYDSNGNYITEKSFWQNAATYGFAADIVTDGTNIYFTDYTWNSYYSPNYFYPYVVKMDSNLNIVWSKYFDRGSSLGHKSVCVDDSGNVYVLTSVGQIVKLSSSGSKIWERTLSGIQLEKIRVKGNTIFGIGVYDSQFSLISLPTDGTIYQGGSMTYTSTNNLAVSNTSFVNVAGTFSVSNFSDFTTSTTSLTEQTSSFTSSKVNLF